MVCTGVRVRLQGMAAAPGPVVIVANTLLSVVAGSPVFEQKRSRSAPPLAHPEEPTWHGEVRAQQLPYLAAMSAGLASPSFAQSRCATAIGDNVSAAGDAESTADRSDELFELETMVTEVRPCPSAEPAVGRKGSKSMTVQPEVARTRPCKGKRERIKKAMALIECKILQDLGIFSSGRFFLPPYYASDPEARARAMAHLAQVAADAYARFATF